MKGDTEVFGSSQLTGIRALFKASGNGKEKRILRNCSRRRLPQHPRQEEQIITSRKFWWQSTAEHKVSLKTLNLQVRCRRWRKQLEQSLLNAAAKGGAARTNATHRKRRTHHPVHATLTPSVNLNNCVFYLSLVFSSVVP